MTRKVKEMVSGALVALGILLLPLMPALAEGSRFEGFHIGAFGGAAILDSTVTFPARAGQPAASFVDQGGDGFIFGARAGVTVPRQSFQSVENGAPANADWSLVPAFGLGGEVHVTQSVAIRFDATYSIPSGANRIESWRMTAGALWRFTLDAR